MKLRNFFVVTVLCWMMVFTACGSGANFNQRSYQILKTSQSAYDLATDGVINLHKNDSISAEDYAKIEERADIYAEAHNAAVDAMKAFNMGLATAEETGDKLTAVSVALTELLKVAQPYILKLDKEEK
jgi:hypothetical protein